jgi:hypothetical protein
MLTLGIHHVDSLAGLLPADVSLVLHVRRYAVCHTHSTAARAIKHDTSIFQVGLLVPAAAGKEERHAGRSGSHKGTKNNFSFGT